MMQSPASAPSPLSKLEQVSRLLDARTDPTALTTGWRKFKDRRFSMAVVQRLQVVGKIARRQRWKAIRLLMILRHIFRAKGLSDRRAWPIVQIDLDILFPAAIDGLFEPESTFDSLYVRKAGTTIFGQSVVSLAIEFLCISIQGALSGPRDSIRVLPGRARYQLSRWPLASLPTNGFLSSTGHSFDGLFPRRFFWRERGLDNVLCVAQAI